MKLIARRLESRAVDSQFRIAPFHHLVLAPIAPDDAVESLLRSFQAAEWVRRASTFYRFDVPCAEAVRSIVRDLLRDACASLQNELETTFGCSLSPASNFEIHRYCVGDGIGPHTDAKASEVRCILNLNSGWSSDQGNIWIFASDSALTQSRSLLPSMSNTAYAFPTGPTSYHALSVRRSGVGYGVTIRFPRRVHGLALSSGPA